MATSPVLDALRRATASAHQSLEVEADVEARLADRNARADMLAAFHDFHGRVEAVAHPALMRLAPDFTPRARTRDIAADLQALGLKPPAAVAAEPAPSAGVALGWVYVAEGSMLGGRIIRRRLSGAGIDMTGLEFLDPFGEETGERWRALIALMDAAHADGRITIDEVVRGGIEGFDHASAALAPRDAVLCA